MSQGLFQLRYDGDDPELYQAHVDSWDNPDSGALYEIHFSGVGEAGAFSGSCVLEKVQGWTYEGKGRWHDHRSDGVYVSLIRAQLSLVGKQIVLKGRWVGEGETDPYDLYVEIEDR